MKKLVVLAAILLAACKPTESTNTTTTTTTVTESSVTVATAAPTETTITTSTTAVATATTATTPVAPASATTPKARKPAAKPAEEKPATTASAPAPATKTEAPPAPGPSSLSADGAGVFKAKGCPVCHGANADGNTAIGKKNNIPDFHSSAVQSQLDAELAKIMTQGKGPISSSAHKSKNLSADQVKAVIAWIRSLH
jgi:mono/diheme cytochrome c family protein